MSEQTQSETRVYLGEPNVAGAVSGEGETYVSAAEELEWLMSLALDGELDAVGEARLETLLAQEESGAALWSAWRVLDADLARVPAVLPPVDFAANVERRMAIRERQRRLRAGVLFGLAAATLWASALVATVLLGAFLWTNQSAVLGGFVHNFASWWSAVRQVSTAFLDAGGSLLATEQTRNAMGVYVCSAALILGGWIVFLRRTLHVVPEHDA